MTRTGRIGAAISARREGALGALSGVSDDSGFTLVEVLIATLLLGVLLAMTIPIVSTLFRTTTYVSNSYSNENQLLPIGTSFQNLIRSVVEPAPNLPSGQPVPAYGIYSTSGNVITGMTPTSMTFFTNVGNSFGSNGPAEVTAALSGSIFTVNVQVATGNCPGLTAGTACSWGSPRTLFTVRNVVNPTSAPIFAYTVAGTTYSSAAADTTEFATCSASNCPASEIDSVQVNLEVNVAPGKGGQAQDETVVYELSSLSQTYQPEVG